MKQRFGWRRLDQGTGTCGGRWRHDTGWEVWHCGHPTALLPYTAHWPAELKGKQTAKQKERLMKKVGRIKWKRLVMAQLHVEWEVWHGG